MRVAIILCLCFVLVGCASPRQRCLAAGVAELRTVDRLIAETEGNLARGYAIEREPYVTSGVDLCFGQ